MQTGKPLMSDDPFERVVVETAVMNDPRLLVLLRLLSHAVTHDETTELRRRGYLPGEGLTLTATGQLKLAELGETTI